jgi:hypothetical protein
MRIFVIPNALIISRPFTGDLATKNAAQSPSLTWRWSKWCAFSLRSGDCPAARSKTRRMSWRSAEVKFTGDTLAKSVENRLQMAGRMGLARLAPKNAQIESSIGAMVTM